MADINVTDHFVKTLSPDYDMHIALATLPDARNIFEFRTTITKSGTMETVSYAQMPAELQNTRNDIISALYLPLRRTPGVGIHDTSPPKVYDTLPPQNDPNQYRIQFSANASEHQALREKAAEILGENGQKFTRSNEPYPMKGAVPTTGPVHTASVTASAPQPPSPDAKEKS